MVMKLDDSFVALILISASVWTSNESDEEAKWFICGFNTDFGLGVNIKKSDKEGKWFICGFNTDFGLGLNIQRIW